MEAPWASYPNLRGGVERREIRLLANNGPARSPVLPELPPLADIIPGFDMVSDIGIYARTGTLQPIIDKITALCIEVTKQPDRAAALTPLGMEPVGEGPARFAKMIAREINAITQVAKKHRAETTVRRRCAERGHMWLILQGSSERDGVISRARQIGHITERAIGKCHAPHARPLLICFNRRRPERFGTLVGVGAYMNRLLGA
jgi:hypothetical protein